MDIIIQRQGIECFNNEGHMRMLVINTLIISFQFKLKMVLPGVFRLLFYCRITHAKALAVLISGSLK